VLSGPRCGGSGVGVDLAAARIGERDDAFGVTADLQFRVVVVNVVSVAQVDHVFGVGDSVGAIFEDVMRLCLADPWAARDTAWPIPMRKVPVLPPVRVIGRGEEPSWLTGCVEVLYFEGRIAQQRHQPRVVYWWSVFVVEDSGLEIPVYQDFAQLLLKFITLVKGE
jgi:hypothetical protein